MSAPYPWQHDDWARLTAQSSAGTLGHAYLLAGRQGLGKFEFAQAWARALLCEAKEGGTACGECRSCALLVAGNHPDLKTLQVEEDKSRIVIEQVRGLTEYFSLKPHYGVQKIGLIYPAEAMNGNAANALLKILEEPPPGALIVLVAHRPGQLLQTLQSRCQKIKLNEPDWQSCIDWLNSHADGQQRELTDVSLAGAPLDLLEQLESKDGPPYDRLINALLKVSEDPRAVLACAQALMPGDIRALLDGLEIIVQAQIMSLNGQASRHLHLSTQGRQDLQKISNKLNSKRLFFFLDQIASARSVVLRSSGVRDAEIIENLFYIWARVTQAETQA